MMHILKTLLLLLLLALTGCASGPTNSIKIQPHFLEGVPANLSVGLLPVQVSSLSARREKSKHLDQTILAALRQSKLFERVVTTRSRSGSGTNLVLQVRITDGRVLTQPPSTLALNLLTFGMYSLFGGELDRFQVRIEHSIQVWAGERKVGEFTVVNLYSAPVTFYRDAQDYIRSFEALSLTPQIVLERLSYSAAK